MSQKSRLEISLQKLNVFFKYSGMNLYNQIETPLDILMYRWLFAFNFLWVLLALIAAMLYMIVGVSEGKNLTEVTSIAPCFTFSILAVVKSFFHIKHEKDVLKLIQNLKELERSENPDDIPEKEDIVVEETRFLHVVLNVLFFLNFSMIVVFDMFPLLVMLVKYHNTGEFEMMLPYLDVFVFIPCELKYWVLAYFHQIWTEVVVLLEMGASDCLFFVYCTNIRVQFKLLHYDLRNIVCRASGPARDENRNFKVLVKRHQDLIASSNILENIYSTSMLCNFLSSSVVICLTGFNVTVVDDVVVVITFITFLCMGLIQIFLLCFFADMMRSASEDIGYAVYSSRWYLRNPTFGKQVLLVMTRTRDPCTLTAAGFADVNLRAFMRVLSTAWSYFALLQTLYRN